MLPEQIFPFMRFSQPCCCQWCIARVCLMPPVLFVLLRRSAQMGDYDSPNTLLAVKGRGRWAGRAGKWAQGPEAAYTYHASFNAHPAF